MLARCGRVAHICEANFIGIQFAICFPCCNRTFLNFPVRIWKIREKQRQKFKQGNGAIAARWQAKAGVEPPFAGCERPFSLRTFHLNSKISPCNPSLKIHFSRNALFAKTRKNRKIAFAIKKLFEFLDNRPRNLVQ